MDNNFVKEAKFIERSDGMFDLLVTIEEDACAKICEILAPYGVSIEEILVQFLRSLVEGTIQFNGERYECK